MSPKFEDCGLVNNAKGPFFFEYRSQARVPASRSDMMKNRNLVFQVFIDLLACSIICFPISNYCLIN